MDPIDKIDAKLMPLVMDQTHANGKMSSVSGKLVSGRAKGLNRLVARQRNQTGCSR